MNKQVYHNIKNSIEQYTFYFISIYTIIVSVMLHKTISAGVYQVKSLFLDCFIPLFFVYITYFIISVINYKVANISYRSILVKPSMLTFIPLIITLLALININNISWDLSIFTIFWVFILNLYLVSLILISVYTLKLKAIIVLGLFILSPWFSNLTEPEILKYSPFEIIITILKSLKAEQTDYLGFSILSFYTVIILLFIIKYNKQHEKKY
jgi:hypothetical protein